MSQEVDIVFSEAYLKGVWWIRSYKHGYKLNKIKVKVNKQRKSKKCCHNLKLWQLAK